MHINHPAPLLRVHGAEQFLDMVKGSSHLGLASLREPNVLLVDKPTLLVIELPDRFARAFVPAGCVEAATLAHLGPWSVPTAKVEACQQAIVKWFAFTDFGLGAVKNYFDPGPIEGGSAAEATHWAVAVARFGMRPLWNDTTAELWWHGKLVRNYLKPAPDQSCVMRGFQAEGWKSCIANPLVVNTGRNHKAYTKQTINALNRGQEPQLIWFRMSDGGRLLHWEPRR